MTEFSYYADTSGFQVIDTYDIPSTHRVVYEFTVINPTRTQTSRMEVSSDGLDCYEILNSFTADDSAPIDFTSYIDGYVGQIAVDSIENNTNILIKRTDYPTERYGENTQSGRIIHHTEGFGMEIGGSYPSVTVREANNNLWTSVNGYNADNPGLYVPIEDELLSNTWIDFNGSQIISDQIVSSGQNPNYQYQEINAEANYYYRLSANTFYEIADDVEVKEMTQRQQGQCFIRVGKTPGSSEYLNYNVTTIEEAINFPFFIDQDTFYVSIGFGARSNKLNFNNYSLKKAAPCPTWNNEGTLYIKWNDIGTNDTLLDIRSKNEINISISVNATNHVHITQGEVSVNVGTQTATNEIHITKDLVRLNGANTSVNLGFANSLYFDPLNTLTLSYVPIDLLT